jgi:hypothetical protein
MSYGRFPFAVDLTRVEGAFGCRDETLLAEASGRFDLTFDEAEDDPDDDEYDAKAIRDIIAGRVPGDGPASARGYALKKLCENLGRRLPSGVFCVDKWLAPAVDEALARAGVPGETFRMIGHLQDRGSPVAFLRWDGFPYAGYLRAAEVGPALHAVRAAADLDGLHPEVRDGLAEVRGWLEACSAEGRDLVCFYH